MSRVLPIIFLIGTIIGIIIIIIIALKPFPKTSTDGCLHRDFQNGGTVCVCNKKHCDILPPVEKVNSSFYVIYTSSKDGLRFDKQINPFEKSTNFIPVEDVCEKEVINCDGIGVSVFNKTEVQKIIINEEKVYQKVLGWGGSFTDATGYNIKSLSESLQNELMRAYFSENGLQYNLGRVPMGGTDFSMRGYTYLDNETDNPNCEDPELTKFKLAEEDYKYKLPMIHEAQKLSNNQLKLVTAPWTPPRWMKEGREYRGVLSYLRKSMYQPWANYFVKFLEAYRKENVSFWGVSTGNEPFFAMAQFEAPGLLYTPEQMRDFIHDHWAPTLRNSSFSDIVLMATDDMRSIIPHTINTIFSKKENVNYIDGLAVHWYFANKENAHVLEDFHNEYPNKFILSTEACTGYEDNKCLLGSWERGEEYARDIIEDMNHWVIGWIDWNLALNPQGGPNFVRNFVDAPIIIDENGKEFYKQPMFYVLGHFSKFVPRDSVRIYSTQCGSEVPVVAFKRPDSGIVVVILNKTDDNRKIAVYNLKGGEIKVELRPRSISTIIYW